MIGYAIIMLAAAALFAVVTVLIYKGKTQLIHDYHQTKVTDKAAYGKAFGKAMAFFPGAMALSGVIALLGEGWIWAAIAVVLMGFALGVAAICRVQKKHNGGVF